MNITVSTEGATNCIAPEGRFDTVTAPELEECVSKIPEGTTSVRFDFAKVEYVSSAGLRILLVAQKRMKASGGEMVVANVPKTVRDVFDITGFSDILTIV